MKIKYAFNLGRVFTLSLAELFAVFENMKLNFRLVDLYREVLIIETEEPINTVSLQKHLGGTVKIMQVLDSLGRKKFLGPGAIFKDYFDAKKLRENFLNHHQRGKILLGVSLYPMAKGLPLRDEGKKIGLMIKAILTTAGFSVRVVLPQEDAIALPSVVVTGERLFEKGAEIDFLVGEERIWLAKTLTVQDFEDYGRRDYQRPARDNQIGMLPPKIAQILINLAEVPKSAEGNSKKVILDPFVGSGTIIQETMLMGLKGIGSDILPKAIDSAEKNLQWIRNRYKLPLNRFELFVSDVKDVAQHLPVKTQIEAIVTEGTLGPAYNEIPPAAEIEKNFAALEKIYHSAFKIFPKILEPGKRVVAAIPAYRLKTGYKFFPIVDKIEKLGYAVIDPIPPVVLEKFDFLQVTPRKSIIYDRKDQFVSREIFIFKGVSL